MNVAMYINKEENIVQLKMVKSRMLQGCSIFYVDLYSKFLRTLNIVLNLELKI